MIFPKANLHTHCSFGDGKNTVEELTLAAMELGMSTLGFSDHAPTSFTTGFIPFEKEADYRAQVLAVKEKYRKQIGIFCGIEQDFYSQKSDLYPLYDYRIGSVHFLKSGERYLPVDYNRESILLAVKEDFEGDIYRYLRSYYEHVAGLPEKTDCQIVGHFDLVEKFNTQGELFDSHSPRYRKLALEALDALLEKNLIFEINTGCMARGYCKTPFPSGFLLRRIAEKRGRVILSSDAHKKEDLLLGFAEATAFAHACGIGGLCVLTEKGFETIPIK